MMARIRDFEALKVVADGRRLAILRLLLAGPGTLSQLGRALGMHPAQVRHHLKQLEAAGLVALASTEITGGFVEKYYRATAHAFVVNVAIVPERGRKQTVVAMGSHDPALELVAGALRQGESTPDFFAVAVGSLDGLVALRQGACQLAGCHLMDETGTDFNRSYVRHIFPGERMHLLTLSQREQGLLVAPGNPRRIGGLADLARRDVTFVNRGRGTGTRLWLDRELGRLGIGPAQVRGYGGVAGTHYEVAEWIAQGRADVGLGVMAAARQWGLDFVPLFEERYELVMPEAEYEGVLLRPVLDFLQTAGCRRVIGGLAGYRVALTGEERVVEG